MNSFIRGFSAPLRLLMRIMEPHADIIAYGVGVAAFFAVMWVLVWVAVKSSKNEPPEEE